MCLGILHGFDFGKWPTGTPQDRLALLPAAQEHILAQRPQSPVLPSDPSASFPVLDFKVLDCGNWNVDCV